MDKGLQQEIVRRLIKHVENETADLHDSELRVPKSDYYDPDLAAREVAVLRCTPTIVAFSSDLAHPGDYMSVDLLGTPVLAIRQEDGTVKAFVNVCRHRGAKVVWDAAGNKRVFSCPYHGWCYERSGALRQVKTEGFEDVDATQHGLVTLPVAEALGIVWVRLAGDEPIDVVDYLGAEVCEQLESLGISRFRKFKTVVLEEPVNWKLIIDGFGEVYHINYLHANTVAKFVEGSANTFDLVGKHARRVSARRGIGELTEADLASQDLLSYMIISYLLVPATQVTFVRDHFEIYRVLPDPTDPAKSQITLTFLIPPDSDDSEYWDKNVGLTIKGVVGEDWVAARTIQAGLHNSGSDYFIIGRNESGVNQFHRRWAAELEAAYPSS